MFRLTTQALISAALAALLVDTVQAGPGPEALGDTLTPNGAQMAGNADGSIPEWSGRWLGAPPHVDYDGSYNPDPYADDEPLFTITADNMDEHADRLGEGQKALFRQYPDSFRMHVYPTRRDFRQPDSVYEDIRRNAEQARLSNNGLTLEGAYGGVAFPIPQNGDHLIYNVLTSSPAWFIEAPQVSRYVRARGSATRSRVELRVHNPYSGYVGRDNWQDGDIYAYSISEQIEPARERGVITFTRNTFDHAGSHREAWQWDPGIRRLRRAPDVQHDYPVTIGPRVVDEQNGFNGSPERFEWRKVGTREVFVPFHNYRLDDRSLRYDDLTATTGHPDPEYIRYELRRVWVLEGHLRDGMRHVYGMRRFYIEEDSWFNVMADMYDRRGELWRMSYSATIYAYDAKGYFNNVSMYHDFQEGSYSLEKLTNEEPHAHLVNQREPRRGEFSQDGIRRYAR